MMRNLGQCWSELRCKGYRSFDYINHRGGGWGVAWLWGGLVKDPHTVSNTLLDGAYAQGKDIQLVWLNGFTGTQPPH